MERFWSKVDKDGPVGPLNRGPCWLWTASTIKGYGAFRLENQTVYAHRIAWEAVHGPIPAGVEIDHLCSVPRCVNPDHLELVTHAENVRRGRGGDHQAAKTHCPKGHPYEGDNVRTYEGRRRCLTCKREQGRETYHRTKQLVG